MTKKCLLIVFCLLLAGTTIHAQGKPFPRNTFYVEGLGQGLIYSVNYEYGLTRNWKIRVGFTSWKLENLPLFVSFDNTLRFRGAPIMLNYLCGNDFHHLEFGLGVLAGSVDLSGKSIFLGERLQGRKRLVKGTGTLGYRFQPSRTGPVIKLALTPLFDLKHIDLFGGIGLGLTF